MTSKLDKPKCWGIGLGRTGTKSLLDALQILGYTKVSHNPASFEELHDVDAAAEAGCQCFYKYLDARYPDSKFILTTREIKSWINSNKLAFERYDFDRIEKDSVYYNAMVRNRIARWGTVSYNERVLMEKYYAHHYDVLQHFRGRPDKLLVIDIIAGEGWSALCPFLEVPIPDVPFPVNNNHYYR